MEPGMTRPTMNTAKVRHPCAGMTKAQRELFERLAIGMDGPMHPKTLAALGAKGLVWRGPDRVLGRDRFGPITIPDYYIPLPVHHQWCKWCSANVKDEE